MKFGIEVRVPFRAGHRLVEPYHGKCNNVHGEGFTAIINFDKEHLDECGMIFDFGPMKKKIKEWIDDNWDHAYIYNSTDDVGEYLTSKGMKTFKCDFNPTSENLAKYLFDFISEYISDSVTRVGIIESFEDSIAWYQK